MRFTTGTMKLFVTTYLLLIVLGFRHRTVRLLFCLIYSKKKNFNRFRGQNCLKTQYSVLSSNDRQISACTWGGWIPGGVRLESQPNPPGIQVATCGSRRIGEKQISLQLTRRYMIRPVQRVPFFGWGGFYWKSFFGQVERREPGLASNILEVAQYDGRARFSRSTVGQPVGKKFWPIASRCGDSGVGNHLLFVRITDNKWKTKAKLKETYVMLWLTYNGVRDVGLPPVARLRMAGIHTSVTCSQRPNNSCEASILP